MSQVIPACPRCKSGKTRYVKAESIWCCDDCDEPFAGEPPAMTSKPHEDIALEASFDKVLQMPLNDFRDALDSIFNAPLDDFMREMEEIRKNRKP